MQLSGNTVLITEGASPIGLALAEIFVKSESRVVICGRRRDELEKARRVIPEVSTIECDLASEADRLSLFSKMTKKFSKFNVLVNNAVFQSVPRPLSLTQDWESHRLEIAMNFEAPLHLSMLFAPHLLKQSAAAIINLSTGMSLSSLPCSPIYAATKAGFHAFTLALREQLKTSNVEVFEILPPIVTAQRGIKERDADISAKEIARITKTQLETGMKASPKLEHCE